MPPVPLPEDDANLEQANEIFWQSLLHHIQMEFHGRQVNSILDVGCHQGGLLAKLSSTLPAKQLTGIEPAEHSRQHALFRLRTLASTVAILPPERWADVPASSVDLVTCHEVLHLIEDLHDLFANIARVLCARGSAFIVMGCHLENPVWKDWSSELRDSGQTIFDHSAFKILQAGASAGLQGAIRPLRRDGWVLYNPDNALLKFSSIESLFDHHYRNKLLFRFLRPH